MHHARIAPKGVIALGLSLLAGAGTLLSGASEADAAVAYVRSTVGAPWGSTSNEEAMDLAFGVGGWDDLRYENVAPATLFSPMYTFIFMEGSDSNATELEGFVTANLPAMEAWVNAGGGLFLNAGPNEGANQNWGFGGVTLNYPDFPADPGMAADAMHPIWLGPFLPTSPANFTGGSFAHATVSGGGVVALIIDSDGGNPQLAEKIWGSGSVVFGGLTTANFWNPAPESLNLRANIIAYLSAGGATDTDMDGILDGGDNCPMIANPMQEDGDMDGQGDACDPCPMSMINDDDMDMACDDVDNCVGLPNPMQADDDMDGLGNLCDECPFDPDDDLDNDTLCGDVDNCPGVININQADDDMDGLGNLCDDCPDDPDNDVDMDGVCALDDNCPDVANDDQADADGDGVGDACDDMGGDSSSGGDPDTGTGDSGSVDTTGDADTGVDPTTSGGGGDTTGGGVDPTTTTAGADDDDADPSGCACTSSEGNGDRGPWWLVVMAGAVLRRRRRAA